MIGQVYCSGSTRVLPAPQHFFFLFFFLFSPKELLFFLFFYHHEYFMLFSDVLALSGGRGVMPLQSLFGLSNESRPLPLSTTWTS